MSATPFRQRLVLQLLANQKRAKSAAVKGFTLIELLVVIVILGVLGAVGYQAYLTQVARAYAAQAQNTATALAKNCAALSVTGDEADWQSLTEDSVDSNQVTIAGACNGQDEVSTITVTVGNATTTREAEATVTAEGQVTPASLPEA